MNVSVIVRTVKHILEFAAGLAAIIAVAVGFLAWKLPQGPIALDLIEPNIRDALNNSLEGFEVDFESTYLHWSERAKAMDIAVRNAKVFDAEGTEIAEFPEIDLRFPLTGLLQGRLAPSHVELVGASAILQRQLDGSFGLGLAQTQNSDDENISPSQDSGRGPSGGPDFIQTIFNSVLEPPPAPLPP